MIASEDEQTFLFADLAGFTALTEAHGDEAAADLVADFVTQARELLPEYEAEIVKVIGDALMLRSADAGQAVGLACCLVGQVGGRHGFPSLRIGINSGPAVQRDQDWFGATVNLASRVAAAAAAGEVLVTSATRDAALAADAEHEFQPRGQQRFRHIAERVEVFVVDRRAEAREGALASDPVCHMAVDPTRSDHRLTHRGHDYVFCSEACLNAFGENPEHYRPRRSRQAELRISDRTRERGATMLKLAYQNGRLSLDELDERLGRLYLARTRAEIGRVLQDLPSYRRARRATKTRRAWASFFPLRRRRR